MNIALHAGGGLELSAAVFDRSFNEALVHQVVTAYLAGGRSGSRAQKSRSEQRGGGRKPWRQKGTGRARVGSIRNPIWGGFPAFAAKPQDHLQKVNRKMYRGALSCILSELIRQERVVALSDFPVNTPKTQSLLKRLESLGLANVLIVADGVPENLLFATRNLKHVEVVEAGALNPVSLISFDKVLLTASALKKIEQALT